MKAHLMYRDRDFDLARDLSSNDAVLVQDLELDRLFEAMGAGDAFLLDVARKGLLTSLTDVEAVRYRQEVLADCVAAPAIVREIYAISVEAIERERKVWGWTLDRYPESTLRRSVEVLELFVSLLKRLRQLVDDHADLFRSDGFSTLFAMLAKELDDQYLATVEDHLQRLKFEGGLLISAELGKGCKAANYVLRKSKTTTPDRYGWLGRFQEWIDPASLMRNGGGLVYQIADRDESGFRALTELKGRGISVVARALAQSMDHILAFFSMLRLDLAFYISCLNLHDRLADKGEVFCFPEPAAPGRILCTAGGLYDVCLSLSLDQRVVGNDMAADGKQLVMITGANRGGKSTFLRSVGIAQLMLQAGMFVAAKFFRADLCNGVFTHYKREEDTTMRSGKLDEELRRMSAIVDRIKPDSVLLLNESFASTNEREGSEIARQLVRAMVEKGIKVFYVTHLFDLAHGFCSLKMANALFLRAERLSDGQRTFRLAEGDPLPTSYGEDLYRRIFEAALESPQAKAVVGG